MTIAKSMRAKGICAAAALALLGSAAFAQDVGTGLVTQIDRISGTIAIRQRQDGTVGTSAGGTAKQFKAQGISLDALHAGDEVSFTLSGDTITRIEKKK